MSTADQEPPVILLETTSATCAEIPVNDLAA